MWILFALFGVLIIVSVLTIARSYTIVPPGHIDVATLFGKVMPEPFGQGLHSPVNPFYRWHRYDIR